MVLVAASGAGAGCSAGEVAAPHCEPDQRLGIVAQSVPTAAYLPCVDELAPGWRLDDFDVDDDGTRLTLRSDRAAEPVQVELTAGCDTTGAVPIDPRGEGVRTSQLLTGIAPDYAGALFDVFPGGCVRYRFRFERGPHIGLMDELQRAVSLYPRRQLRQELRERLGVELDGERRAAPTAAPPAKPPTTSSGRWAPT